MRKNLQIIFCMLISTIFYCSKIQSQHTYHDNILSIDFNINPISSYLFNDPIPRIGINYSRRIKNFRIKKRNLYINLGAYYNLSNTTVIDHETEAFQFFSRKINTENIRNTIGLSETQINNVLDVLTVDLEQKFLTISAGLSYPILPRDPSSTNSSPWKLVASADFMYHIPLDNNQYIMTFRSSGTIPENTLADYEITQDNFGIIQVAVDYSFIINLGFAIEYQLKTIKTDPKHLIGLKTNLLLPSYFWVDEEQLIATKFWSFVDENDFKANFKKLWFPFINMSLQYTFKF